MAKVLRMMTMVVLVGSAALGCAAKDGRGGSGMASAGASTQGGGEAWTGTAESAAKFGP